MFVITSLILSMPCGHFRKYQTSEEEEEESSSAGRIAESEAIKKVPLI
jgi:hypothetical protein